MNKSGIILSVLLALVFVSIGGEWLYGQQMEALHSRQSRNVTSEASPTSTVVNRLEVRGTPIPTVAQVGTGARPSATAPTPTVGIPTTTTGFIIVNTPTTVTVTAQISVAPIAGGVNLLRLGSTGAQPTILGVMHDDGENGDTVAADGIYTLQVPFNESTSGQIQLETSAAFKGLLKRVTSAVSTVGVWGILNDPAQGVSLLTPPAWNVQSYENTYTISSPNSAPVSEGDAGNEIQLNILPLGGFVTIQTWLRDYYSGEVDFAVQPITFYSNPFGVQFAMVSSLPGLSSDNVHAFTILNGQVLELSVTPASTYGGLFNSILATVKGN